jgi:hypothetical protein
VSDPHTLLNLGVSHAAAPLASGEALIPASEGAARRLCPHIGAEDRDVGLRRVRPSMPSGRLRSASAGVAAATVWALEEPIDQRLLRCD